MTGISTDAVLSYTSALYIGSHQQWVYALKANYSPESLADFLASPLGISMKNSSREADQSIVNVFVRGWAQKPSRYLWGMMRFSDEGGIYLPTDKFTGTGVEQSNGVVILDRLITSQDDGEHATIKDIAKALMVDKSVLNSRKINLELIFKLLSSGITKEECDLVSSVIDGETLLAYRANPSNSDFYGEVVYTVDSLGRRREAFAWLILLDDATVSYRTLPFYGEAPLEALRKMVPSGVSPEIYKSLRKKGFLSIESIIDITDNQIDEHLIDSMQTGTGVHNFTVEKSDQSDTLDYLASQGFIPRT